ncbi:DUF4026 domain-containing protein [Dysgonomonas sp. 520]|uniref:DUF4026 domain-containing protein n=1 Tax=Dysgonomonas sp. 520 TaxID=2302931 RepID=UPI0013D140BA|nr:DUF4026 domain-containing protein [Dysgonomonas sp. 520]NDW10569.1 DUF4026 domain-containing protein [Dysgonomonas sp. 520]
MTNGEKYDLLADGETGLPSAMGILAFDQAFKYTTEQIENSLRKNKDFEVISFGPMPEVDDFAEQAFNLTVNYQDEEYNVELFVNKADNLDLRNYGFANQVAEEDMDMATKQEYFLETSMFFGDDALTSFHLQLKIMLAIVPDASLIIDFMSYRLLSAQWGKMTAKSPTPPSPDYLYSSHVIYDGEGEDKKYWFHTHGLHRCGSVELEMLNIGSGAQQMNDLLNMVVKKFISSPTKEKEKFTIGYDGMGIVLSWLRWEEALNDFPKDILGGMADRDGEGNVHAEPTGVLFAVEDNNMVSPEIFASTLADNPIFYISTEETERMSALARERFAYFETVFRKEGKKEKQSFLKKIFAKKEEEESWSFLVKLGLTVDDDQSGTEKEHLWYEVVSIDNEMIKGKLLNQPYWISNLNEGDVKTYPVELLTDWLIYAPDATYTTDTIYQLGFS